jgi:hypothetical protein
MCIAKKEAVDATVVRGKQRYVLCVSLCVCVYACTCVYVYLYVYMCVCVMCVCMFCACAWLRNRAWAPSPCAQRSSSCEVAWSCVLEPHPCHRSVTCHSVYMSLQTLTHACIHTSRYLKTVEALGPHVSESLAAKASPENLSALRKQVSNTYACNTNIHTCIQDSAYLFSYQYLHTYM